MYLADPFLPDGAAFTSHPAAGDGYLKIGIVGSGSVGGCA